MANLWIEGMKAPLRNIKWITSGTHCTPEQLRLPFHTLQKPTDIYYFNKEYPRIYSYVLCISVYILLYTVIYTYICYLKKVYTRIYSLAYVLCISVYILLYTVIYRLGHVLLQQSIYSYILWASTRSYIRLWTLYICVQVRIYAYVRVCDIFKLQKHAWLADSNWESHAYCKAALTNTPPALMLSGVSYDICLLNWGSSKFEPRCLLADVGHPVLSRQHPRASHDGWFRTAGFQV